MWCPKCRNEYVNGITRCADCGEELVETLPDERLMSDDSVNASEGRASASDAARSHVYISNKAKTEDMKSTAYTFTIVGVLGLLLVILFACGVLPIHTAGYTKVMISVVMGVLFAIFLVIGIRSFGQLTKLQEAAEEEDAQFSGIMEWFRKTHTAASVDAGLDTDQPEETLYFARYEAIKALLLAQYPGLEEMFLDHIIETLYSDLF